MFNQYYDTFEITAEDFDGDEEWYDPFTDVGRMRYYYDDDYSGEGPF